MKKIRNLILVLFVFIITGCGNKQVITSNSFKEIMEDNGFIVTDSKEQFSGYEHIQESLIATKEDKYQIEFYVIDNEENAIDVYNNNRKIFEDSKGSSSAYVTIDFKHNNKYSLSTDGKYKVISRINNTLVYLNVDKEYRDDINKILKKLGY